MGGEWHVFVYRPGNLVRVLTSRRQHWRPGLAWVAGALCVCVEHADKGDRVTVFREDGQPLI